MGRLEDALHLLVLPAQTARELGLGDSCLGEGLVERDLQGNLQREPHGVTTTGR